MNKSIKKNLKELKKHGITTITNALSIRKCNYYINRFENLISKFEKNRIPLNTTCQVIENPFRHDLKLINLIYNKKVDDILSKVLDKNYVLINTNIINRINRKFKYRKKENVGRAWHSDSRVLGNKRLEKGFSYIVVTMFNNFTSGNASTMYVPGSHLKRTQPKRRFNYKSKKITGQAGSIVIFDTAMWHKAGKVSNKDRWSMYSYYGPWFMKPYYRFPDMLGNKVKKKVSKKIQKLLHYHSTPPKNEIERRHTLTNPL